MASCLRIIVKTTSKTEVLHMPSAIGVNLGQLCRTLEFLKFFKGFISFWIFENFKLKRMTKNPI